MYSRQRHRKKTRFTLIMVAGAILALAVGLVLIALKDQIVYFKTPSDIVADGVPTGVRIRMGGLVKQGSVKRTDTVVHFTVTDTLHNIGAYYTGLLPDLFREGQGVVLEGTLSADGVFIADMVLAKHDENYMPSEVVESLKAQGVWEGGGAF